MKGRDPLLAYTRGTAIVTAALYTAGHAAIGLPLLVGGAVWRLLTRRLPLWQSTPLDLPLAAFAVVMVLSAATSAYPAAVWTATLLTVVSGAAFFGSFAWLLHRDPGARITLLRAWALGAPPAAAVGLLTSRIVHQRAYFPQAPMGTNAFGTTLFLGSLCALGLACRARGRERALWLGCSLISVIGVLATTSRSSLAGWAVGAAYLAWREFRQRPRRLAVALASGLIVLSVVGLATPTLGGRVEHAVRDLMQDRVGIWQVAVEVIRAHPLLGTGPGTFLRDFTRRRPEAAERKWSAHNLWLHYTVETGLLGLGSLLWIAAVAVRQGARTGRRVPPEDAVQLCVGAMLVGLLVDQFGDNTVLSISTVSGVWLLLALLVVPVDGPGRENGAGNCARGRGDDTLVLPPGPRSSLGSAPGESGWRTHPAPSSGERVRSRR